jgi:hypothetical protein
MCNLIRIEQHLISLVQTKILFVESTSSMFSKIFNFGFNARGLSNQD